VNLDEYIQKLQVDREQQKPDVEHTLSVPALAAPAAPTATATTAAEQNTDKSESSEGTEVTERVLTFAEIKHLIETDQTHLIPNNKVIPDELNVRRLSSPFLDSLYLYVGLNRTLHQACRSPKSRGSHGRRHKPPFLTRRMMVE
jgi:hypothetical protein